MSPLSRFTHWGRLGAQGAGQLTCATYDPSANAARLRRHPGLALARAWQILWAAFWFWSRLWHSKQGWLWHRKSLVERERANARFLTGKLVELGPTFIKVGQALSTRYDLLPLAFVKEMARLQDRVPPFDTKQAIAIIERELGRGVLDLFPDFDPEPISAASIGQVYQAHTNRGDRVIVKVQRPNLPWILSIDLAILRLFAMATEFWIKLQKKRAAAPGRPGRQGPSGANPAVLFAKDMPYVAIVDQFGKSLFDQTDFIREGQNADRFRENFAEFAHVRAPSVYWEYTTRRVITQERIDGVKFNDVAGIEKMGVSFRSVVNLGVRCFIKQLLEDGFFHADTHPGNIFVTKDGDVVYIDWGMTDTVPQDLQIKMVDLFLHMIRHEYLEYVEILIELEMFPKDIDRSLIVPIVEDIYETQIGRRGKRYSMTEILERVSTVLYRYPFRLPERFSFLMRTVATMEGVVLQVWPDFRFLDIGLPYAAKLLLTVRDPLIRDRLVEDLLVAGSLDLNRLQETLQVASQEASFSLFEFLPEALRWLLGPEGGRMLAAVTDTLFSTDTGHQPELDAIIAMGLAGPALDPLEAGVPVLEWLRSTPGSTWLSEVAGKIDRLDVRSTVPVAFARILQPTGPESAHTLFAELLATADQVLATLGPAELQRLIDWSGRWAATPAGRAGLNGFASQLASRWDRDLAARALDLLLAAQTAGLSLRPLVQALLAALFHGDANLRFASAALRAGVDLSKLRAFILLLATRDGLVWELLVTGAKAAGSILVPGPV